MTEEWRDIKGWEGYQVSNLGRVRSMKFGKERIMLLYKNRQGYLRICLCKHNKKIKFFVHRLVAEAFIPNPNNYTVINHIDENKENNRVDNLEWCTQQYNTEYSLAKPVNQYTLDMKFIKQWVSTSAFAREYGNIKARSNLTQCCKHNKPFAYGFKWFYVDDPTQYIDQPLF